MDLILFYMNVKFRQMSGKIRVEAKGTENSLLLGVLGGEVPLSQGGGDPSVQIAGQFSRLCR